MDKVEMLLEKVAAKKPRKKKNPGKGRKPRDVYAPDMSKGAPGTRPKPEASTLKPKKDLTDKARGFKSDNPTPKTNPLKPKKEYRGNDFKPTKPKSTRVSNSKALAVVKPKPNAFKPKKLGLIAAGLAGTGVLAAKIRANRKAQQETK